MNLPAILLPPVQAVAALQLSTPSGRRRALAGVPPVALALASLELTGAADPALAPAYWSITAGILILGLGITLGVTAREWIRAGAASRAGIGATAAVGALGVLAALPLIRRGGALESLGATLALGLVVALVIALSRLLEPGRLFRWVESACFRRGSAGPARPLDRVERRLLAGHLACAAVAAGASHLLILLPAVAAAAILGVMLERRLGRLRGVPWGVLFGAVSLTAAVILLVQVARGFPLSLGQLHDAPFSPAFEILVSLLLAAAAWPLLSLWPFHASPRGPATGVAGATLLFRLAAPALPDGFGHWQPALYLLLAIAAWYGAATRRDDLTLTAAGGLGLLSLSPMAGWSGLVLVALAGLLRSRLWPDARWLPMAAAAGAAAGAGALLPVLAGGLAAQAFYTVLVCIAAVVALAVAAPVEQPRAADGLEPASPAR
jgi:hypothetical protein